MNKVIIRRMQAGQNVITFSVAHPSADSSFTSVLGRLKDAVSRMIVLAGLQVGGFLSKHASTVQRQDIRRRIRDGFLRHR